MSEDDQPNIWMSVNGFDPTEYTAVQIPNTEGTSVLIQSTGDEPPVDIYTFLSDEETPYSLFGGTGNSYAVSSDRPKELIIPKETPDQVYVTSPTPVVSKGTKGTINVITGALETAP